jgi:hypothetical protein
MLLEGFLQMCQCELNWAVRDDLRRLTQSNERRTDRCLSVQKSSPDSIGSGITQTAIQLAKGVKLISRAYRIAEILPQAIGAEE